MPYFPQVTMSDLSARTPETKQYVREALDYAANNFVSRNQWRDRLSRLYNAYNGIIDEAEIASITKFTGKRSKTKYVKYRLGHSKLKTVHGDFLKMRLASTVTTINRDAVNRKMLKYKRALGLALAKPQIEKAQEMGFDVFPGIKIPDMDDKSFWRIENFVLSNEEYMQAVIDDKIGTDNLKVKFYRNFIDQTISAEMHGKIEKDRHGRVTYRYIEPYNALYEENVDDPLLDRSPYRGERKLMYFHEILSNPEWQFTAAEKKEIEIWSNGYNGKDRETIFTTNFPVIPVYIIEIKCLEPYYLKYAYDPSLGMERVLRISNEYYNKHQKQIKKEVNEGRYRIEESYREVLWELTRIGDSIYLDPKRLGYLIQVEGEDGKYRVESNYCSLLFGTVDGHRVSLQEIFLELERTYDDVRFQINRELKRIKGSVVTYDEAFLPKNKRFIDIYFGISEDGILRYNSSAEGNEGQTDAYNGQVGLNMLDMGKSQVLPILINQAMEIERTVDRLTGIVPDRQGTGMASQTATMNMNNIEASQTITYDHFFFMNIYIQHVLIKIAEKAKLNILTGEDTRMFIHSENAIRFMKATPEVVSDNYGIIITDGKKESEVLQKMEMWFQQEVNAGMLRSKDIARFYMESTLSKALKVLDKAHEENRIIQEREGQRKEKIEQMRLDATRKMAIEDREDIQEHEKELAILKAEADKEKTLLKESLGGVRDAQKQAADVGKGNNKNSLF